MSRVLLAAAAASLLALPTLAWPTRALAQANPLQQRSVPGQPAASTSNPLRQPSTAPRQVSTSPTRPQATETPAQGLPRRTGTRERSPAQLANDERMRKCGAEWRANKAALTARGQTWRTFNGACRERLRAAGQ